MIFFAGTPLLILTRFIIKRHSSELYFVMVIACKAERVNKSDADPEYAV